MPQTRGNVSWMTNKRIEPVERKVRTGNLLFHLENRSISNLSLKHSNSILEKKYRSQADLDFQLRQARKEANNALFQTKLINEMSGQWSIIIRNRKSLIDDSNKESNIENDNIANSFPSSIHHGIVSANSANRISKVDDNKRLTKSAKLPREKYKSKDYLETYSRSYNYLRNLVEIDHLTRDRFQKYYESKLIDRKAMQEKNELMLKGKLNEFYSGVDEFVKKNNNNFTFDEQRGKDDKFLKSLQMPDFSILLQ